MAFISGQNRDQYHMNRLEDDVALDSPARFIDAFVDSLDLQELGFDRAEAAGTRRPGYDGGSILELYLYGAMKGIRSSRQLQEACILLVEVRWLVRGMRPDFRTIADFRKRNADHLKTVFDTFNDELFASQKSGFVSVDGTKVQASCARNKVHTKEQIEASIPKYERRIQ